jgi:hypothetical protein
MTPTGNDAAAGITQISNHAENAVKAIGTPIVALAVALLALTIAIGIITYLMSRTPKQ